MPSREEIEAGKSSKGGFTRKQLAAWGVPWPPPKGWRRTLERGDVVQCREHQSSKLGMKVGVLPSLPQPGSIEYDNTMDEIHEQILSSWEMSKHLDAGWFTIEGIRFLVSEPTRGIDPAQWIHDFKRHVDDATVKYQRFTKFVELVQILAHGAQQNETKSEAETHSEVTENEQQEQTQR